MQTQRTEIHPSAHVADGAVLGEGVQIGPGCVVGAHVRLGDQCVLHPHVVVDGDTSLGARCEVFPFSVLGTRPQDKKLRNTPRGELIGKLIIGDDNEIREHVVLHGGTPFGRGKTTIGDRNMILGNSHVGHDSSISNDCVLTNGAMVAGHVEIQNNAILGGLVGVHQFSRVGAYSMIGGGAMLAHDAPPFSLVQGDRARLVGANVVGLRRGGFTPEQSAMIKKTFRLLFWRGGLLEERIANARAFADGDALGLQIIDFVETSQRGIVSPRGRISGHDELGVERD